MIFYVKISYFRDINEPFQEFACNFMQSLYHL